MHYAIEQNVLFTCGCQVNTNDDKWNNGVCQIITLVKVSLPKSNKSDSAIAVPNAFGDTEIE